MQAPPPSYVPLANRGNQQNFMPPPYRGGNHPYQSEYYGEKSKRGCCCRCLCCFCCFVLILIIFLSASALYLYAVYRPQVPSYTIEGFNVKSFKIQPDSSLATEVEVTVKAVNPNNAIGFTYGRDSSIDVSYKDSTLCSGKLPHFHQGYNNLTMMEIEMKGKSAFGSSLQESLKEDQKNEKIPLLVKVKAPIKIEVGDHSLISEIFVYVNCSLVVDNLKPNKSIGILSSHYEFSFAFIS